MEELGSMWTDDDVGHFQVQYPHVRKHWGKPWTSIREADLPIPADYKVVNNSKISQTKMCWANLFYGWASRVSNSNPFSLEYSTNTWVEKLRSCFCTETLQR